MSMADAFTDLDEAVTDDLPEEPVDLDHVNRMLRALRRIEADRANVVAVAEAEAARVFDWLDARTADMDARADAIRDRLRRYHEAVLTDDPRARTIHVPNGTLTARAHTTWDFTDEAAFLAWAAERCPDAIRRKDPIVPPPEIERNEAKRLLVIRDDRDRVVKAGVDPVTSEVPPGLVVHSGVTFSATTEPTAQTEGD